MTTRKAKKQPITDIRAVQRYEIHRDENGLEGYVMAGWTLEYQRGTDQWHKVDITDVISEEEPKPTGEING